MFWADRVAKEIEERFSAQGRSASGGGPLVIRDEKSITGRVHVGSMRGVAIHGAVAKALKERGVPHIFKFELNDFDVFDSVPSYLDASYEQYVGKLVKDIPKFVETYAGEFQEVIAHAGFSPEYYWGSELYESGKMDGVIREALAHAEDIRRIYKQVSGSEKEGEWLPVMVLCERCGRVVPKVMAFDSEKVTYECNCGHSGAVSPFGGKGKLPWKVEWAAKWKVLGVEIEGAGKDHSTKGGARDVAAHIAKEVFGVEPPFDLPYEFFLVGGKKMSSSKGRGSSAKEVSDLVPPKIFRLALLGKEINQQVNFDPEGDTIPVLYDQYDKLALQHQTIKDDDYARLFELLHPDKQFPKLPLPRFSQVAFVVQMPHMDLKKEFPEADSQELEERATYAKKWLAQYAPEKYVFKLQDTLPTVSLTPEQKQKLGAVAEFIESASPSAETLHTKLHEVKEFKAIYQIFLDKESGPKAGWFLASLPRDMVLKRLREAAQ